VWKIASKLKSISTNKWMIMVSAIQWMDFEYLFQKKKKREKTTVFTFLRLMAVPLDYFVVTVS
jgi:hypothetical protein